MKFKINLLLIVGVLFAVILISGCVTSTIKDVKTSDNVGTKVVVAGTVENTLKIGSISGYTLKDKTDTIRISSESLPEEGSEIRVTGVLMKDTILGYYIKADS
jgi:hypothetical protein